MRQRPERTHPLAVRCRGTTCGPSRTTSRLDRLKVGWTRLDQGGAWNKQDRGTKGGGDMPMRLRTPRGLAVERPPAQGSYTPRRYKSPTPSVEVARSPLGSDFVASSSRATLFLPREAAFGGFATILPWSSSSAPSSTFACQRCEPTFVNERRLGAAGSRVLPKGPTSPNLGEAHPL